MANNIELAEKFLPILDGIYKAASKTARMDSPTLPFDTRHRRRSKPTSWVLAHILAPPAILSVTYGIRRSAVTYSIPRSELISDRMDNEKHSVWLESSQESQHLVVRVDAS